METAELLTVGETAARIGLTTHTLRWYEREGLLEPVERDSAGRRRYSPDDIGWLELLIKLRATGMPVRDMRRYAELARQGDATLGERIRIFEEHRDRVLAHIEALRADLEIVDWKIEVYKKIAAKQSA